MRVLDHNETVEMLKNSKNKGDTMKILVTGCAGFIDYHDWC